MTNEPYQGQLEDLVRDLGVDITVGLTAEQAAERLAQYGPNALSEKKRQSLLQKILAQLKDVMVLILIAASLVSAFLGEYIDAVVIIAIVIINAILGVVQEGKAEKAIDALKKMTSPQARVLRGGEQRLIAASELVPGDVVLLEAGDIVPADLRLLESQSLKAEEASLTGESVPVEKNAMIELPAKTSIGDRENMVFMSTALTYGRGRGLVAGTGSNTVIGQIADKLQAINEELTPLQKSLNQLGKWLGIITLLISAIVFVQGYLSGGEVLEMFMTAVSLAVAAIPEGLPAVVTIVLALGMKRMADHHAIVKKLLAVETLGSVDVICSDKTGTLTQNEMTVTRLFAGNQLFEVSGIGYTPVGEIRDHADGLLKAISPEIMTLLEIGMLCNDAVMITKDDGNPGILGDPTEGSLLVAASKAKIDRVALNQRYPRIKDMPFDSERKMMSTFHPGFDGHALVSLTKGAPDIILDRCTEILTASGNVPMSLEHKQQVLAINSEMAKSALRVLAFAYRTHTDQDHEQAESQMTFIGLMGMIDPARPEARDAIALCKRAGIRAVMITGDYRDTAVAIADDLGLRKKQDLVLTGHEIDELSEEQLRVAVESTTVYARVSPDHKVRIVTALRANGHIASMTGDGVNDAMALKSADIGVAMGITGTDVAKGTADMILTDDNFATIVRAVHEGRIIFSNIRKFVGFLLSCNVGEILIIFVSSLLLGPLSIPLLPIQLLWINLVTDSFPALALGQEKGEPGVMNRPPRSPKEPILNKTMIITIITQAVADFTAVFAAYLIGRQIFGFLPTGEPNDGARTYAFVTMILVELIRSYSARSEHTPVFKLGLFGNSALNKAVLLSLALLLVVVYVPFLDPIFHTIPLGLMDWAIILPLAIIPFVVAEFIKFVRAKKH
ncbi:MAG: cation-translocating P-type ATPase [Eubacteriales bacterium]|nr:cation-translocating P-type ATPase [Eubacteriales bacterium]